MVDLTIPPDFSSRSFIILLLNCLITDEPLIFVFSSKYVRGPSSVRLSYIFFFFEHIFECLRIYKAATKKLFCWINFTRYKVKLILYKVFSKKLRKYLSRKKLLFFIEITRKVKGKSYL